MKPEIWKRFTHGRRRLYEARRRMARQIIMKLLKMPWNQTVSVLYLPKDFGDVKIIKEVIPSQWVSFQSNTSVDRNFSHYFKPRISVKLDNPLIDFSTGDVFGWDKVKRRWLLIEETSEWPIEYRIQFAKSPSNSRSYPRLHGSYLNGILSKSHYHRLTEDVPTLLTLGDGNPILTKENDEVLLRDFSLENLQRIEDNGLVQVDELTILTKGLDVGYLMPGYRDTLKSAMTQSRRGCSDRRLYLTRVDERRSITNEPEILKFMKSMEFEVVSPGILSIHEQVTLFSEAKIVVAPHGGALTNLVFADNAEVIEIMPRDRINRCFEWQSRVCGHSYTRLLCDTNGLNLSELKLTLIEKLKS